LEFVRVGGQKKLIGAVALGQSYEDGRFQGKRNII